MVELDEQLRSQLHAVLSAANIAGYPDIAEIYESHCLGKDIQVNWWDIGKSRIHVALDFGRSGEIDIEWMGGEDEDFMIGAQAQQGTKGLSTLLRWIAGRV